MDMQGLQSIVTGWEHRLSVVVGPPLDQKILCEEVAAMRAEMRTVAALIPTERGGLQLRDILTPRQNPPMMRSERGPGPEDVMAADIGTAMGHDTFYKHRGLGHPFAGMEESLNDEGPRQD